MAKECTPAFSGMVACKVSPSVVEQFLEGEQATSLLNVACRNSSNDCVVSGPLEQLDHFEDSCKKRAIKAKRLNVSYGYHSSSMDPIVEPLKSLGLSVQWSTPVIPVASSVHGRLFRAEDFKSDYFAMHARQPVRFSEAVENIHIAGGFDNAVCIEIGPHPIVSPMIRSILPSNIRCPLPSLKRDQDAWLSISASLSELSLIKDDVNWREVFAGSQATMVSLPGYPLSGTEFAVAFCEVSENSDGAIRPFTETGHHLLPRLKTARSSQGTFVFETTTAILGHLISGHSVGGTPICPASVYHELILEAAQTAINPSKDHVLAVGGMMFSSPLIHEPSNEGQTIHVHLNHLEEKYAAEVKIMLSKSPDSKPTLCCAATVSLKNTKDIEPRWAREAALVERQSFYFSNTDNHSTFQSKLLYETIFTRVVRYSEEFHTLIELSVSSSSLEGIGTFKLPSGSRTESYIVSPAFTDTLLHTPGFIANLSVKSSEICICSHVESIEVIYNDIDLSGTFTIYCHLFDGNKGLLLADAFILNSAGQTVAIARNIEFKKLSLSSFQRLIQPATTPPSKTMEPVAAEISQHLPSGDSTLVSSPSGCATPITADDSCHRVKATLLQILSSSCGFSEQEVDYSNTLDQLGIDSLMQIEITAKITQAFPGSTLDHDIMAKCDTIQSFQDILLARLVPVDHGILQEQNSDTLNARTDSGLSNVVANIKQAKDLPKCELTGPQRNPVPLHTESNAKATPLFCFHDGSGQVSMYANIRNLGRTLWAFFDPDYTTKNPRPASLSQMAARYATSISKSETPSLILGGKYEIVTLSQHRLSCLVCFIIAIK